MSVQLVPVAGATSANSDDPQAVVSDFLAALADGDAERARELVDDDILYVNVGLPAVRGRVEMDRVFDLLSSSGSGFEVYMHAMSADGPVVLTERTDILIFGNLRMQFWVWGRFDVRNGKITLWRDSFDFFDIIRGTLRGLISLAIPSFAPKPPTSTDTPPGR